MTLFDQLPDDSSLTDVGEMPETIAQLPLGDAWNTTAQLSLIGSAQLALPMPEESAS